MIQSAVCNHGTATAVGCLKQQERWTPVEARTSPSVDPNTKIKSSRKTSGLTGKRTTKEELQGAVGNAPPRATTSHQEMSWCRGQNISDQRPPEDDPAAGHVGTGAGVQDGGPKQDPTPDLYSHLKLLW